MLESVDLEQNVSMKSRQGPSFTSRVENNSKTCYTSVCTGHCLEHLIGQSLEDSVSQWTQGDAVDLNHLVSHMFLRAKIREEGFPCSDMGLKEGR